MECARVRCHYHDTPSGCLRGGHCFFQHGSDDARPVCHQCRANRAPPGRNFCRHCYKVWRLQQLTGRRPQPISVLAPRKPCDACAGPTTLVIGTGEPWCRKCQPALSRCQCGNRTTGTTCLRCRRDAARATAASTTTHPS